MKKLKTIKIEYFKCDCCPFVADHDDRMFKVSDSNGQEFELCPTCMMDVVGDWECGDEIKIEVFDASPEEIK
jgi:hypothetical protein